MQSHHPRKSSKSATNNRMPNRKLGLMHYFSLHAHAFFSSMGRLWRTPIASLLTIAVIGIALALPTGLFVLLHNIQKVSSGWANGAQISLFLRMDVSPEQADLLMRELSQDPQIASVKYISPQQGLQLFEQYSGFQDILQQLHSNPLPPVVVVHPAADMQTPTEINLLLQRLKQLPQVDVAQLDMAWIKRLYAFIHLGKRVIYALGILLAIAVILIIGNTIRLSIENYRSEIETIKLVGATPAFIRRPFLYTGILYGFLGSFLAYVLITTLLISLSEPVEKLVGLYQSDFYIRGLESLPTLILLITGFILGLAGAWLAVSRQIRKIEPR